MGVWIAGNDLASERQLCAVLGAVFIELKYSKNWIKMSLQARVYLLRLVQMTPSQNY